MLGLACVATTVDDPAASLSSKRGERRSSTPKNSSEREEGLVLVEAAKQGDKAAFGKLVEQYQARAFAVAIRIVRDPHEAEELVQEAFLRVHRGLQRFNGRSSFSTWLHRIVKNLALDVVRRPRFDDSEHAFSRLSTVAREEAESLFVSRVDGADPFECLVRREAAGHLQEALGKLPSYHRDVVLMCAIEELSYDEMARAMKVSRGTIMSRLFHARKKLRYALGELYAETA